MASDAETWSLYLVSLYLALWVRLARLRNAMSIVYSEHALPAFSPICTAFVVCGTRGLM